MRRQSVITLVALALLSLGFSVGVVVGTNAAATSGSFAAIVHSFQPAPTTTEASQLEDVWATIHRTYVNRQVNDTALIRGAISGMVGGLGDPYSVYLAPAEARTFQDEVEGVFQGVGMEVGYKDNQLTIIAPLPGSPAAMAGLRSGDALLSIDGQDTSAMKLDQAVALIRGPQGSTVTLTIRHSGATDTTTLTVKRQTIKVDSVRSRVEAVNGRTIGILSITSFAKDTGQLARRQVQSLISQSVSGIIIDVRDNPGGYLDQAVAVTSIFVDEGVVVSEVGRDGRHDEQRVNGQALWASQPMVVLVNGGTASAAEIVAGALQDHHRATVIGATTFGKGSVQDYQQLSDGSSLKLTVAKWLTPNGRSISEQGIQPDLAVAISTADQAQHLDRQLQAAELRLAPKT